MARQRLVKPDVFQHEDLHRAEMVSALPIVRCYIGLWTQADRRGCFEWRAGKLKANIAPYDTFDFEDVLTVLEREGFIVSYVVGGKKFGWIPTLPMHQTFNVHEKPNRLIPDPPNTSAIPVSAPVGTGYIPPGSGSSSGSSSGSGAGAGLSPEGSTAAAATKLTVAANNCTAAKFGEQADPLIAGNGKTHALARDILAAKIPVDFAIRSIARQVDSLSQPVRSMAYFRPGIIDDWAKHNERVAAAGSDPVQPLEGSKPRRRSALEIVNAQLAREEAL